MKYCPFCGATLMGGAASFCAECGKKISSLSQTETENRQDEQPAGRRKDTRRQEPISTESEPSDDGYDGYYDDVPPLDNGHEREELDPEIIKKVVMVIGGALLIIALSIGLMLLL